MIRDLRARCTPAELLALSDEFADAARAARVPPVWTSELEQEARLQGLDAPLVVERDEDGDDPDEATPLEVVDADPQQHGPGAEDTERD